MDFYRENLIKRFVRYAETPSQSSTKTADEGKTFPSTPGQRKFAEVLSSEIKALGFPCETDENSYVISVIESSPGCEKLPSVLFSAHLDTSDEVSGTGVKPRIFENYQGETLELGEGICLNPGDYPDLKDSFGETIITASGDTLLGADDKAGIAIIMEILEFLNRNPDFKHGEIKIMFSPDEETGHGMDKVPLDKIRTTLAYTLDGGRAPEVECECFNAYKAEVTFKGVSIHPGEAKNKMVNSVFLAGEFLSRIPKGERPETTEKYQGFYYPGEISGSTEETVLTLLLRDFTDSGMEKKQEFLTKTASLLMKKHPGSKITLEFTRQYSNMKKFLDKTPLAMELLLEGVKRTGLNPVIKPIRGGTDGSRLSEMGIPTPNIFTGGHNFHSKKEWLSVEQMVLSFRTVVEILRINVEKGGINV